MTQLYLSWFPDWTVNKGPASHPICLQDGIPLGREKKHRGRVFRVSPCNPFPYHLIQHFALKR